MNRCLFSILCFQLITLTSCMAPAPDDAYLMEPSLESSKIHLVGDERSQESFDQGIRNVMRENQAQIKSCYFESQKSRGDAPAQGGLVVIRFTVDALDGTVAAAAVDREASSLRNSLLERCLLEALRSWVFQAHPDSRPIEVSYPFDFQVGSKGQGHSQP